MSDTTPGSTGFDAAYYDRYYFDRATRVAEPGYFERVAAFITAYLDMLGEPVSSVLDAGCGAGLLHAGLRRAWPRVRIDAFDVSEWACARYGWQHASLENFEARRTYDLVICHDVVQYLPRRAAVDVIDKFARWSRCALFFGVLTSEDWRDNCDQQLTDGNVYLRSTRWYRQRMRQQWRNAGGGLYIRQDSDIVLYSLEHL